MITNQKVLIFATILILSATALAGWDSVDKVVNGYL